MASTKSGSVTVYSVTLNEPVPSFKNAKRVGKKNGKPFLYTDPEVKARMRELKESLSSSSSLSFQMLDGEIPMACWLPFLMNWYDPASSPTTTIETFLDSLSCGRSPDEAQSL